MMEMNNLKIPERNRLKDFLLFQKDDYTILWDKLTLSIYYLDEKHREIYRRLLKIEDEKEIENFVIKKISEFPQLKNEFKELFQGSNFKDESKNLRRLNLLISQQCPLGCLYCYAQKGTYGNTSFMVKQVVKKSLKSFFSVFDSVEMVQFFGGEPLLNIDLIEYTINLLEEFFHKKIIQRKPNFLVESGLGVSKESLEKFIELLKVHPEIRVTVSCDGPAEIHNYLRPYANGKPSYEGVIENLNILKGYGQPHAIEATYTKIHYDAGILPSDLIKYFKNELGLKDSLIFVIPVISKDPSLSLPTDIEAEILHEYEENMIISLRDGSFYRKHNLDEFNQYVEYNILSAAPTKYFCDGGIASYTIDTCGDIYPCHMLIGIEKFRIGNINEGVEQFKINLANYANMQKAIVEKSKYEQCEGCFLQNYCSGCPSANYLLTGNMDPTFSGCNIQKQVIKDLLFEYIKNTVKDGK
jgi:uncharacterized protein